MNFNSSMTMCQTDELEMIFAYFIASQDMEFTTMKTNSSDMRVNGRKEKSMVSCSGYFFIQQWMHCFELSWIIVHVLASRLPCFRSWQASNG